MSIQTDYRYIPGVPFELKESVTAFDAKFEVIDSTGTVVADHWVDFRSETLEQGREVAISKAYDVERRRRDELPHSATTGIRRGQRVR